MALRNHRSLEPVIILRLLGHGRLPRVLVVARREVERLRARRRVRRASCGVRRRARLGVEVDDRVAEGGVHRVVVDLRDRVARVPVRRVVAQIRVAEARQIQVLSEGLVTADVVRGRRVDRGAEEAARHVAGDGLVALLTVLQPLRPQRLVQRRSARFRRNRTC